MNITKPEHHHCWQTAATDRSADTSPAELSALSEQLTGCHEMRGRGFFLHCYADAVASYWSSHFVTTVIVVVLLVGLAALAS